MSSLRQRTAASAEVDASPSSSSSPAKLTSNGDTFIDAIFASLFQPGLNAPLHNLMNYTFYALFLTLSVMIFLTSANIHVIALFGIALGLFASVNWCVFILLIRFDRKADRTTTTTS